MTARQGGIYLSHIQVWLLAVMPYGVVMVPHGVSTPRAFPPLTDKEEKGKLIVKMSKGRGLIMLFLKVVKALSS